MNALSARVTEGAPINNTQLSLSLSLSLSLALSLSLSLNTHSLRAREHLAGRKRHVFAVHKDDEGLVELRVNAVAVPKKKRQKRPANE